MESGSLRVYDVMTDVTLIHVFTLWTHVCESRCFIIIYSLLFMIWHDNEARTVKIERSCRCAGGWHQCRKAAHSLWVIQQACICCIQDRIKDFNFEWNDATTEYKCDEQQIASLNEHAFEFGAAAEGLLELLFSVR